MDLHIKALEKMGAEIEVDHGYVEARAARLPGRVSLSENHCHRNGKYTQAAVLAEGETIIENAALEPEITDLAELLTKMGAKIEGAGTPTIRVRARKDSGATHTIIPDRIEAGTFLVAGAITNGDFCSRVASRSTWRDHRQAAESGVEISAKAPARSSTRREKTCGRRHDHRRISRLRHGHAGAVHGARHAGGGLRARRNNFREPFPARQRNDSHGSEHSIEGLGPWSPGPASFPART